MRRKGPLLALPGFLLLLSTPRPAYAEGALLEKTVDVPRDKAIPVEITYGKATITTVETHNDPKQADIDEAKATDPKDKTYLIVRFRYNSDDYTKHHVSLRAIFLDAEDGIVGEAGRSATLDPKVKDDTVSFPLRVKTLDWPKAAKLKVMATFRD